MPIDLNKSSGGENADMPSSTGGKVDMGLFGANPDLDLQGEFGASKGGEVNQSVWTSADVSGTPEEMGK